MKVFFVFDIKSEFVSLYKDNQLILFDILRQIYCLDRNDVLYGYNLLNQLVKNIDKDVIDREIFIKYHRNIPYSKDGNVHYYNNLYRDEVSRMIVSKRFIKIELEQKKSTFFEIINKYSSNYFVCDFDNLDYFFLKDKVKTHFCYS